jgi:hypothetical protein
MKKNTIKKIRAILAYSIFAVFLLFAPFYVAYTNGASFMWSVAAVPVSWIFSGMGAYIAMFCMNWIERGGKSENK